MSDRMRRFYVVGVMTLATLSFLSTFVGNPTPVPLARWTGFALDVRPFRGTRESANGRNRTELTCRGADGTLRRQALDLPLLSRLKGPHSRLVAFLYLFTDSGRWREMGFSEAQYRRFIGKALWWGLCDGREWARALECPIPTTRVSVVNMTFTNGTEGERSVSCAR